MWNWAIPSETFLPVFCIILPGLVHRLKALTSQDEFKKHYPPPSQKYQSIKCTNPSRFSVPFYKSVSFTRSIHKIPDLVYASHNAVYELSMTSAHPQSWIKPDLGEILRTRYGTKKAKDTSWKDDHHRRGCNILKSLLESAFHNVDPTT